MGYPYPNIGLPVGVRFTSGTVLEKLWDYFHPCEVGTNHLKSPWYPGLGLCIPWIVLSHPVGVATVCAACAFMACGFRLQLDFASRALVGSSLSNSFFLVASFIVQ